MIKLRWTLRGKGVMDEVELQSLMTDEEKKRIEELVELEENNTDEEDCMGGHL